jgi:hypothetical protein
MSYDGRMSLRFGWSERYTKCVSVSTYLYSNSGTGRLPWMMHLANVSITVFYVAIEPDGMRYAK